MRLPETFMTSPRPVPIWLYALASAFAGSALTLIVVSLLLPPTPTPVSVVLPDPLPTPLVPSETPLGSQTRQSSPEAQDPIITDPTPETPETPETLETPEAQEGGERSTGSAQLGATGELTAAGEPSKVEDLERFTQTLIQLQPVLAATQSRLAQATTDADKETIEAEFETAARKVITNNNLTTAEYQAISKQMQQDPILELAINTIAARLQSQTDTQGTQGEVRSEERDPFTSPR